MQVLQYTADSVVVVLLGSVLGSLKSSLDGSTDSKTKKCINFWLGFYCGVAVAMNYHKTIELGFLGLIALVSAMVGTNILEVVSDLAPDIARKLIKKKLKG